MGIGTTARVGDWFPPLKEATSVEEPEQLEIWVCMVRCRAYSEPKDLLEYYCMSKAGSDTIFMKQAHKEAGCGRFVRTGDR